MNSIKDYIQEQNFTNAVSDVLVSQLQHLISMRDESLADIKEMNDIINDIVKDMEQAGIDVKSIIN